jgi:hypothetical protein
MDTSPFTLSSYLRKLNTFIAAHNYNEIANGIHLLKTLPIYPIKFLAVAAVIGSAGPPPILPVAAINEETMIDFTNRKSEYRWLYGNVKKIIKLSMMELLKDNKTFNDGVTDIIKEDQRVTMEMT